jgi:hypothetical protein
MLQSFIGTFDAAGLRSLRNEDDTHGVTGLSIAGSVPFWAILDTEELPSIQRALMLGYRGTALELLVQQAKSLGRLDG